MNGVPFIVIGFIAGIVCFAFIIDNDQADSSKVIYQDKIECITATQRECKMKVDYVYQPES